MTDSHRVVDGRYLLGDLLGHGATAYVYKAHDRKLERDVAIKMIRPSMAESPVVRQRFQREAKHVASLHHPAIASIFDSGVDRDPNGRPQPYIVMEFVLGMALSEVLSRVGPIIQTRALSLVGQVCRALQHSHEKGILHRDVRPANILVTADAKVKVVDFGIARTLHDDATATTMLATTLQWSMYYSPEQARGEQVDVRSDIYSVGCVLFALLCGQPPFVGDNPLSVAYQHVRENPRAPSASYPQVAPEVDAIILKALAKSPDDRYQSADRMWNDIESALAGRRVNAPLVVLERGERAHAYYEEPSTLNRQAYRTPPSHHDLRSGRTGATGRNDLHASAPKGAWFRRMIKARGPLASPMRDPLDKVRAGGRHSAYLPVRTESSAALIGISEYLDNELEDIPSVKRNLNGIADCLSHERFGTLDGNRTHVLHNAGRSVMAGLCEIADEARDTLVVYYTGHGFILSDGQLYLAMHDTVHGREMYTSVPFSEMRTVLIEAPARRKILILDCCFSGRAIDWLSGDTSNVMAGQVSVEGTYVITATSATRLAHAPIDSYYSSFTGQLVEVLRVGTPRAGPLIRLGDLYRTVHSELAAKGLPLPQQRAVDSISDLAIAWNRSFNDRSI